jgi:hypothetical protein
MGESSQKSEVRSQNENPRAEGAGSRPQDTENRGQNAEELRGVIRELLEEFVGGQKRTESLEQRVNELVAENAKTRAAAEEAQRSASIREELQRLGVSKIDLAYKAVKDDVYRSEDGRLLAQGGAELRDFLTNFVSENPELLPARLAGGSGASAGQRSTAGEQGFDLARIRPGMNAEEMDRIRREVARVASQTLKGW